VLNACLGKELLRNPETLEMLLKEDVGDDNGDVEEMDQEVDDAQEVPHEKDEDPSADIEGGVFSIFTDFEVFVILLPSNRLYPC